MAFWVWDPVKDISYWSDEMYRMIGREPGSIEASSLAWLGAIYPEDSQDAKRAMVQALRRGEDYHNQYRVVWPDGSIHWVEARGKFERNTDNRITRVIGVSTDITDRKRAENAMLRAEKLAVAGRLAASVAHEINNPLEAVSNLLYLISISETAESAHQLAREALDQLMRVSMITQQTLKFHRQAGAPKLASLAEIAHSALGMFRGKLAQANIAVEFEAPREDTGVLCMPNEIQQVFANLISNAVEAMPNNGRLAIRLRPSRHWLDSITKGMRITFLDSGTGMDRNTKRRLFEPFFTTKIETGTGLGMWVVAQLIERHHGHIRVWSSQRPQHTATAFSIFLPFQPTGAAAGANPAESPATEVTSNAEVRTLANATD
jgi:PAS domain S-box-containing protein